MLIRDRFLWSLLPLLACVATVPLSEAQTGPCARGVDVAVASSAASSVASDAASRSASGATSSAVLGARPNAASAAVPGTAAGAGSIAAPEVESGVAPFGAPPTALVAPAAPVAAVATRIVPDDVSRQATARAQIALAAKLKGEIGGRDGAELEPAERDARRARAIDAYRAVRVLWPDDPEACSEASFRAAELLRAAKSNDQALREFEIAREKGSAEGFGSRARLELAHLLRRMKQPERALAEFEALAALAKAPQDRRDEAGLWAGRVQHELGQRAQACRTWQRLAEQAADPLDRIQAWDWLVQDLVEAEDLEGAAGMLERAREALGAAAAEETKLGERVRNALQRMRSVDLLQRALEKRRSETSDAKKSEAKS